MITMKVASYTKHEIDNAYAYISETLNNLTHEMCVTKDGKLLKPCDQCEMRHFCDDLYSVIGYLRKEKIEGYPHIKTK